MLFFFGDLMEKLVLLHKSFISPVLLEAIKKNNWPVFAEDEIKKTLTEKEIPVLSEEKLKENFSNNPVIYFNAEDCLALIKKFHDNKKLKENINFFKDRFEFKKAIKENYPEHFISEIKKEDFDLFKVPEGKELIIKPSVGFHSVGIKRFSSQNEWNQIKTEILQECKKYSEVFDENVLSDKKFLIEDYIKGDELVCDAYFNSEGKPVILGLYHHPFADDEDFRDLVYYTSTELVEKNFSKIKGFLELIASKREIKNFPVHLEVRIRNGKVYPIEINPLRFGGFGLSDLPFYAFGINSFEYFFSDKKCDWNKIFAKGDKNFYAFVVGQTPANFNTEKELIDVKKYKETFNEILNYVPIDAAKYKFFSTTYTKSSKLEDLTKYLTYDFDQLRKNK